MRLLNAKIKISPCEEALAEGFSIRFYTKEKEGVEVDRVFWEYYYDPRAIYKNKLFTLRVRSNKFEDFKKYFSKGAFWKTFN